MKNLLQDARIIQSSIGKAASAAQAHLDTARMAALDGQPIDVVLQLIGLADVALADITGDCPSQRRKEMEKTA